MKITAVLLAAGQGTRMKSDLPKVLHPVAGKPMIWHVLEAVTQATTEKPVVVVGHGARQVKNYLGESAETVLQEPQLGTGHAVHAGRVLCSKAKRIWSWSATRICPCCAARPSQQLVETQNANRGPMSLLTVDRR